MWFERFLFILLFYYFEVVVFKFIGIGERDYGGGLLIRNCYNLEVLDMIFVYSLLDRSS